MEPTNEVPTKTITIRVTPAEIERMEKAAAKVGMSRSPFARHCTITGLQEIEQASTLIDSPVIGVLLQLFSDLGPQETADEFRRIRNQLASTDDSYQQQKMPFMQENPSKLGIDCGLGHL
jgi:hypothetical protein